MTFLELSIPQPEKRSRRILIKYCILFLSLLQITFKEKRKFKLVPTISDLINTNYKFLFSFIWFPFPYIFSFLVLIKFLKEKELSRLCVLGRGEERNEPTPATFHLPGRGGGEGEGNNYTFNPIFSKTYI